MAVRNYYELYSRFYIPIRHKYFSHFYIFDKELRYVEHHIHNLKFLQSCDRLDDRNKDFIESFQSPLETRLGKALYGKYQPFSLR